MDFYAPGLDTVTASETGVDMPVLNPQGRPLLRKDKTPMVITVYGPDSSQYRDQVREMRKRQQRRAVEGVDTTPDDDIADTVAMLARLAIRWNVQFTDGKDAPCNYETVSAFLKAFPATRDQMDSFIGRRANFTQASSGD